MRIDIISDTVCPWCFIGKRRLERALGEAPPGPVEVLWHPFQLNPDMPPDGMDRAQYLELKFGPRRQAAYAPVVEAGQAEGIPFAFERIPRMPNTFRSHRLIRRAGALGRQDSAVDALFRAYFLDGRNIGEVDELAAIAEESVGIPAGAARDYLAGDADAAEVRAEDEAVRRMGVAGVPCFIIERRYVVHGAQDSSVFRAAFERVARDREGPPPEA